MNDISGLEPVEIASTAGLVAERLRKGIVDGTFAPGSRIGEAELSKQLSTSRGPVREAMQRLIQEGLLRAERNRGVFVVDLGRDDIEDIYAARAAIELRAIFLLAGGDHGDGHIAPLAAILDEMSVAAAAGEWSRIVAVDLEFHEVLVAATKSRRLVRMYATLVAETRICLMQLEEAYADRSSLVDEHRGIFEALKAHDLPRALAASEAHFRYGVEVLDQRSQSAAPATS